MVEVRERVTVPEAHPLAELRFSALVASERPETQAVLRTRAGRERLDRDRPLEVARRLQKELSSILLVALVTLLLRAQR